MYSKGCTVSEAYGYGMSNDRIYDIQVNRVVGFNGRLVRLGSRYGSVSGCFIDCGSVGHIIA